MDYSPMNIDETRRRRLRQLISERFDGKQARLADETTTADNYYSRILSGAKGFGEKKARQIEEELQLKHGYFDRENNDKTQDYADYVEADLRKIADTFRSMDSDSQSLFMRITQAFTDPADTVKTTKAKTRKRINERQNKPVSQKGKTGN